MCRALVQVRDVSGCWRLAAIWRHAWCASCCRTRDCRGCARSRYVDNTYRPPAVIHVRCSSCMLTTPARPHPHRMATAGLLGLDLRRWLALPGSVPRWIQGAFAARIASSLGCTALDGCCCCPAFLLTTVLLWRLGSPHR